MSTEVQDWSAYEVAEGPEVKFDPEQAVPAILSAEPAMREPLFAEYRRLAALLVPKDDASIERIAVLVEFCKKGARAIEAIRKAELKPLETEIDRVNSKYNPPKEFLLLVARGKTEEANKFLDDRRRAAELEQQRLLAEAAKKQAELDRKAQEARAKAEEAATRGNYVAASVQESKALILEQKAAEVVPMQVAVPTGKVELETSTVSFGGAKKVWNLNGWDKKKPLRVSDPSLASLVGDLSKLPEGVRFILQHSDLNPVYLNASYKGGMKFPAPFAEVNDYSGSRVR